jgi:hypothetical protein
LAGSCRLTERLLSWLSERLIGNSRAFAESRRKITRRARQDSETGQRDSATAMHDYSPPESLLRLLTEIVAGLSEPAATSRALSPRVALEALLPMPVPVEEQHSHHGRRMRR